LEAEEINDRKSTLREKMIEIGVVQINYSKERVVAKTRGVRGKFGGKTFARGEETQWDKNAIKKRNKI